jgi:hypothetical protein
VMLLLSGCATGFQEVAISALCDGLEPYVDRHVEALIEDGGPKSRVTGVELVAGYDGGC